MTPEKVERARNHFEKVKHLPPENYPQSQFPPTYDAKWRYMWKIGQRPEESGDNFPQVVPKGDFPNWGDKMDTWGHKLLGAAYTAAEMAAVGMGLD